MKLVKKIIFLFVSINIFFSYSAIAESDVKKSGIISVPVANLRAAPAHSAELVDQEIMGYTIELLDRKDDWYQVQTEYGYVGWITDKSFLRVTETAKKRWLKCDKVRVSKIFAIVYSKPDETSEPVTNVMLNTLLRQIEQADGWTKVAAPDGRTGFLKNENISQWPEKKLSGEQLRQSLVKTAKSMMGAGYLWGGKSSVASDCSGWTQTVFRANGIDILRDARQQVLRGKAVRYDETFSNVLAGDLLFFGSDKKITHVAMSLGGKDFIHQSGNVHINSFDPNSPNYSSFHRQILKSIRRICK